MVKRIQAPKFVQMKRIQSEKIKILPLRYNSLPWRFTSIGKQKKRLISQIVVNFIEYGN